MKRLFLIMLLATSVWAQDIKRPTTETGATGSSTCVTGTYNTGSYSNMANAYDSGTPPTTTYASLQTTSPTSAGTYYSDWTFTTWQSASGSYSALTLNVNLNCTSSDLTNGFGQCGADYSTNGGSSWTSFVNLTVGPTTNQATYTQTLSLSQNLANLQVRVCTAATYDSGFGNTTTTMHLWDIWTSGTLGKVRHRSGVY